MIQYARANLGAASASSRGSMSPPARRAIVPHEDIDWRLDRRNGLRHSGRLRDEARAGRESVVRRGFGDTIRNGRAVRRRGENAGRASVRAPDSLGIPLQAIRIFNGNLIRNAIFRPRPTGEM